MANFKIEEFYKDTMKTYLNYSQNNQINNNALLMQKRKHVVEQAKKNTIARENNELNRPARAISFGGSASYKASKAITGLVENKGKFSKFVNNTINFVNENEAAYNAVYSLIVAGILKPFAVLNMPGSEEKDKQIVATKNFLQAFLGSFLSLTIGGGFIKKAIDVVKNNMKLIKVEDDNISSFKADSKEALELTREIMLKEQGSLTNKFKLASKEFQNSKGIKKLTGFVSTMFKTIKPEEPSIDNIAKRAEEVVKNFENNHFKILSKNESFIKLLKDKKAMVKNSGTSYYDAFEVLWKNSTGSLTAILKAKISSLLLPGVMAFLFAKKNLEKAQKERALKAQDTTLTSNNSFKSQQAQFQRMMNKDSNISFQGNILNKGVDSLAKGIEYIGMSKVGEKLAKTLAHAKKPSARMSDIESIMITAYWLQNTARNEKIEPSQRLGLNVHSALVTVVSSTAAFIIDWALDGLIDKTKGAYSDKLKTIVDAVKQNNELDLASLKNLNQGIQGIDNEAAKMAIKNACLKVFEKKATLEEALKSLQDTEVIRNLPNEQLEKVTKENLEAMLATLSKTEPVNKELLKQCGSILDAKKVASKLAQTNQLDDSQVKKTIEELSKNYGKKLSKFKSLTIFTLVVRFLVPVLMVPFSGKLKKKIVERAEKRQQAKAAA